MKFKATGISRPQFTRIGRINPGEVIEVEGEDMLAKACRIKYLQKVKDDKEEKCQRNANRSQLIRKPLTGERKLRLTKQNENS